MKDLTPLPHTSTSLVVDAIDTETCSSWRHLFASLQAASFVFALNCPRSVDVFSSDSKTLKRS